MLSSEEVNARFRVNQTFAQVLFFLPLNISQSALSNLLLSVPISGGFIKVWITNIFQSIFLSFESSSWKFTSWQVVYKTLEDLKHHQNTKIPRWTRQLRCENCLKTCLSFWCPSHNFHFMLSTAAKKLTTLTNCPHPSIIWSLGELLWRFMTLYNMLVVTVQSSLN